MVEQLVAFVLGFCICGLIGLALLPLVSGRARRLTLKRIEDRLPMSFDEIEADRDLLRARFAVEKRDLEILAQKERDLRAAESAELGRRTAENMRLEEQLRLATGQLSERNAQLSQTLQLHEAATADLVETRAKLSAHEQELRTKFAEFDELAGAHRDLHAETGALRMKLEEADNKTAGFEARRERLLAKLEAERKRIEALEAENAELRQRAEQAGGPEMADLRAALLEMGREVAARDRA